MKNINNVIEWAKDKGILTPNNASKQLTKVIEELGETGGAYLKREGKEVIDGISKCIGNIGELIDRDNPEYAGYNIFEAITLLNGFTKFIGHDLEYCLDVAYNVIKDRTGKTVDGIFVKN